MSPTPARSSVVYRPGRLRLAAACAWLLLMVVTAQFWAGGTGIGLTLLAATHWLRVCIDTCGRYQFVVLREETLHQVWALPGVMCVTLICGERLWFLRDELEAARWAALRRYLKLHVPHQALGLSMSR